MKIKVKKNTTLGKVAMLAVSAFAATSSAAAQLCPSVTSDCITQAGQGDLVAQVCTDTGNGVICCDFGAIPTGASLTDQCGITNCFSGLGSLTVVCTGVGGRTVYNPVSSASNYKSSNKSYWNWGLNSTKASDKSYWNSSYSNDKSSDK
ncbi:MAG: hypothetical protein KDD69_18485 [Bdellovibrionales bacterium]|nr:hypothetical protein [Bdellovibrionales bacterium]